MVKVITIIGTRPEVVKTVMLHKQLRKDASFSALLCSTGQHSTLLNDAISDFEVTIDIQLESMDENGSIVQQQSYILKELQHIITEHKPNLIIVQGDTLSAFCGAMVAFYNKIELAHIEAGLRTYDKDSPYPEEVHRKFIDDISDYHFAHSESARQALLNEGHMTSHVHMVGNTGIDALLHMKSLLNLGQITANSIVTELKKELSSYNLGLLTIHRRETMGIDQHHFLESILDCAENLNLRIICPRHPNPQLENLYNKFSENPNIYFIEALEYKSMIWLMSQVDIIYSDSGGIQEEAPYLGKKVIVLRKCTERQEMIDSSIHTLYNSDTLLGDSKRIMNSSSEIIAPYGDGKSSERIVEILKNGYA